MTRWLSLLFVAALTVALTLLPEPEPGYLAALNAHQLLELPAGEDPDRTLADEILFGPASEETGENARTVQRLAVRVDGEDLLDRIHGVALNSVVRALRERADEKGIDLELDLKGQAEVSMLMTFEPAQHSIEILHPKADVDPLHGLLAWDPPSRWSLFPPFLAILLAILFRRPVLALFLGVLGGTFLLRWKAGGGLGESAGLGLVDVFRRYLFEEARDPDRLLIVGFVVFMLAMVGILTRAGGIRGLMDAIARFAGSVRSTQIATWLMGLAVFFDDYANTILVGSTMRPLTDRYRIAREKLAYIVDSTAAPVAGLSIFSTWIAYEVSTFSAQLPAAGLSRDQGYAVFLDTLPYRFYCIFTLIFVGLIVFTGRDFGPMLSAERRARREGKLVRDGGNPMVGKHVTALEPAAHVRASLWTAVVPLAAFIGVTAGMLLIGGGMIPALKDGTFFTLRGISSVLEAGSGNHTLFYGSLTGLVLAILLACMAGIAREIPGAAWNAIRSMGVALVILYLAWMMGRVCGDLGTATYLSTILADTLPAPLLPTLLFLLAAVVAFSTGSSWSTMSILLPLVVGLSFTLGDQLEIGGYALMLLSIGAVLEGAIFGDHCSPISDTTVLSSIASASDHIDHVRTQAPYAMLTMGFALLFGYLPCAFLETSPWVALGSGIVAMVIFLMWRGKHVESSEAAAAGAS